MQRGAHVSVMLLVPDLGLAEERQMRGTAGRKLRFLFLTGWALLNEVAMGERREP